MVCDKCFGEGCEACKQEGGWRETKKPEEFWSQDTSTLFRAWRYFHERGLLPEPGGIYDQTTQFLEACTVIDAVAGAYADRDSEMKKHENSLSKFSGGKRGH